MGSARWSADDYQTYATTTSYTTKSREEVFSNRNLAPALDPAKLMVNSGPAKGMLIRESCDSVENPNSTPIIIGLDVTGSMGFVAEEVAKNGLPKLMGDIYEKKPVSDPHLLFAGIGDVHCDRVPLQASQFEPDIKILEQLRELYLEGGGGGNNTESYDLPWYFAAYKTTTDSFKKRGVKGFLFTIGDEMPPDRPLSSQEIQAVFGKGSGDLPSGLSVKELLTAAEEQYKVFHIIAEEGNYVQGGRLQKVRGAWNKLMGPNVINMKDCKDLPEIVIATIRIANGESIDKVIKESSAKPKALFYAFGMDDNMGV